MRSWQKNTGQPYEVVEKDTDRDNYMTAEEAKAYGLIDGVVERNSRQKEPLCGFLCTVSN